MKCPECGEDEKKLIESFEGGFADLFFTLLWYVIKKVLYGD